MRLFVAIPIPAPLRRRIASASELLRAQGLPVRWVDPERYHVTLRFLGEVDRDRRKRIPGALERVADQTGPFDVAFERFGAFPTARKPRVLWLGVEATPELRCLKQDVELALTKEGFDRDGRGFHPHVTLGRTRRGGRAGDFRDFSALTADEPLRTTLPVTAIELVRSRTTSEGPRYTVQSRSPLRRPVES